MERAVAIKKLTKILGKNLSWRVDPKAPDQDDRDEARAKLKPAVEKRNNLNEQMVARSRQLLDGDTEYQRLKAEYTAAKEVCSELSSITMRYRFSVGTINGMFNMIKAEGDSWEEVIAKLTEKQTA